MTTPVQPSTPASVTPVPPTPKPAPTPVPQVIDPATLSIDELKARIAQTSHSLRTGLDELTTRVNPKAQVRQLARIAKTTAIVGTVLFSLLAVRRRFKKK
ncbi:DUF3618 domain-containing protein [Pseudoclavibacter soli]|uniref:DUF3618 domain-containing protein n=1 Tax=Pseudoclavibacter soli TaxID=452623 RepID=UPI00041678D8|nr:DUF3618 domain-containing protein [Pseudoclavibacter soli]